jgi:hypothetical protein
MPISFEEDELISPIHDPIEGMLISEDETRKAPRLRIHILEGNDQMVGSNLMINA